MSHSEAAGANPMRTDVRLARIAGIEIGLNWTWLIVVALVTWSLAAEVFPATNKGLGAGTYVGMAVVATLLFFGSLLLHELGHALQAQREGVEISGITLWVFGGVARFKGSFRSAGAEFRIAIAGPLVTLVIAAVFLGASALMRLPATVDGVASWLGRMNLILFVFNMLPALPLDGGRVLHALLWKARGSLSWATRVAGRLGQLSGTLMVLAGAVLGLYVDVASGLWLVFIGWFVMAAARAETELGAAQEALAGLHVSDAMVRHPVTVRSDETLSAVVDRVLRAAPHTAYPVSDNSHPLGLLTAQSVASVARDSRARLRVRDRMIPVEEGLTVAAGDDLPDAATALLQTELGRALVVHDGELVGLLSLSDVTRLAELRQRRVAGWRR